MSYSHGELVQLAEEGRRKKMPRYIDAAPYEDGRIVLNKEDAGVPVAEIPTADVVERKRGKWLDFPIADGLLLCLRCSSCGVLRMGEPLSFFCPWCGADMRGGGDNVE